jgi:hypothetical protein
VEAWTSTWASASPSVRQFDYLFEDSISTL